MKNVLFVCTESAGAQPARTVWPVVVRAMEEVSIDLSGEKPKRLLPETQLHADFGDDFTEKRSQAEVRACADAERETRKCLAGEVCHALTAV